MRNPSNASTGEVLIAASNYILRDVYKTLDRPGDLNPETIEAIKFDSFNDAVFTIGRFAEETLLNDPVFKLAVALKLFTPMLSFLEARKQAQDKQRQEQADTEQVSSLEGAIQQFETFQRENPAPEPFNPGELVDVIRAAAGMKKPAQAEPSSQADGFDGSGNWGDPGDEHVTPTAQVDVDPLTTGVIGGGAAA